MSIYALNLWDVDDHLVNYEEGYEQEDWFEASSWEGDPVWRAPANPGPVLVVIGSILVCTLLAFFLLALTAKAAYPLVSDVPAPTVQPTLATGGDDLQGDVISEFQTVDKKEVLSAGCAVSDSFPPGIFQWCELITLYADRRDLPSDLIAALIWQESGGNPAATSSSGAVGLMQVMPRDGLAASFMCANGPCFSNRPTIEELKDPEFNIAYGTKMLAGLLARYGNFRDALKSYGPMNVGYYYADKVLGIFQRNGN